MGEIITTIFELALTAYVSYLMIFAFGTLIVLPIFGFITAATGLEGYASKCSHGIRENKTCNDCEYERRREINEHYERQERIKELKKNAKDRWIKEYKRIKTNYTAKIENLKKISPQEFEATIARLYKKLGYQTELTPYVGDEGKDIIATKDGKKYFIECKKYCTNNKVSRPFLQKLYGAVSEHKVKKGILVTTSEFSQPAIEYADRVGIKLINGLKLREMFRKAYGGREIHTVSLLCEGCGEEINFDFNHYVASKDCKCGKVIKNNLSKKHIEKLLNPPKNSCIKCGNKMKLMDGIYGPFFGCTNYCGMTVSAKGKKTFDASLV